MAVRKTVQFLPEIFRTESNRKFLNATLDQLIAEPSLKRIDGYIGRKLAPSYKTSDSYIIEPSTDRQNYQLEASVVIKDEITKKISFAVTYQDLLNQIKYYGGITDQHNRLFNNEYYSFNPRIDLDKFINFSQYYWLKDGPDAVLVSASNIALNFEYTVRYDSVAQKYLFTDNGNVGNPSLTLARGGSYRFVFEDPSSRFYIQSKPGSTGVDPNLPNINVREVFGVTDPGSNDNFITFDVPTVNAQVNWSRMPVAATADYATELSYKDIQGSSITDLNLYLNGLDGITTDLNNKTVIFVNNELIDQEFWSDAPVQIINGVAYFDNFDINEFDETNFENTSTVSIGNRNDVYRIKIYPDQSGTPRIVLELYTQISDEQKILVSSGATKSGLEYYSIYGLLNKVPLQTASLDTFYYQNPTDNAAVGLIQVVETDSGTIDPTTDIEGQVEYVSPNGVIFTNGMRVTFDASAGEDFNGNTYYVEGVGTSIKLIPFDDLVGSELPDLETPDYLTINRASLDQNAWSRTNRWVHQEVVIATAQYNNIDLVLDQNLRARRPIIEFESSLQLYNHGREAKTPIDVLDTIVTNAFTQIQGITVSTSPYTSYTFSIGGQSLTLTSGTRVVFSNDINNNVKNKIYDFNIVLSSEAPNEYKTYIVEASDALVEEGHTVLVKSGSNGGKQWYYNGANWAISQTKTAVNQAPMFDVIDYTGNSFSDDASYPSTTFTGTKIFTYAEGTGNDDSVLGFPLSYRNIVSQGDIQFDNVFDSDTFAHLTADNTNTTKKVNTGLLQKNVTRTTSQRFNLWNIVNDFSRQFQIYSFTYDGQTNLFEVDNLPDASTSSVNLKVTVNNKILESGEFASTQIVNRYAILINPDLLTAGDAIFISIFNANRANPNAFYEVPLNLDVNSLNTNLTTVTLGQIRNHLRELRNNSRNVLGEVPGTSNLRDVQYLSSGGSILQHSAPVVYAGLFLNHPQLNFVNSIQLAADEYSIFKTKFLELAKKLDLDQSDIAGSVDTIVQNINIVKNDQFPWYYSDMLPYGAEFKTILPIYTVLDPEITTYELTSIFNPNQISNQAVLVYLTRTIDGNTSTTQLILGRDYVFRQDRPAIQIQDSLRLLFNDKISIIEYSNTNGSYIPETPTKLGLYPKYIPQIFLDNTYREPINVIQGHDGSITPCFNDFRDQLLLELESRIYNNLKVSYDENIFNFNDYIPGKFRIAEYTRQEFNQILSKNFLRWVGTNRIDYSTNNTFKASDPFTWNYRKFRDIVNGESLPGSWRSIYRYFYDTDRPHTHPWEMLGFSIKPDYWVDRYGPAPYTGDNILMWTDLSLGYIHSGPRQGYDIRYQRPRIVDDNGQVIQRGLLDIIPVDDAGNLRDPVEILVADFDSNKANFSFAVGDIGPAELAWRRSSDYAFSVNLAMALMKPAKYFSLLIDVENYKRNNTTAQFIYSQSGQHLSPTQISINGYTSNGTVTYAASYINWIRDYVKNLGIGNASGVIYNTLRNLSLQLSYKMSGYTDKKFINILAEQSSPSSINDTVLIPDENYTIEVFKGSPIDKIVYSAVIIEKGATGYVVSGYDADNPYFFIIPSQPNNNSYVVTVNNDRGIIYRDFKQSRLTVPYGFEFVNRQQVVDFLVGYQRYLQSKGFVFDRFNDRLKSQQDWILSTKEFLNWAQQGWKAGSALILSPVADNLKVYNDSAVIDSITNNVYGSQLLDINFNTIKNNNFTVNRENNVFTCSVGQNQIIGLARLNLIQYEHLLVLDNVTVFRDVVYVPELGNRQYRLKLVGSKTAEWSGSFELPGFVFSSDVIEEWSPGRDYLKGTIVKNKNLLYVSLDNVTASDNLQPGVWKLLSPDEIKFGVLNNFATNAVNFENFYDIDNQPADETVQLFSDGLIGFRARSYFTNIGIDTTTQSKFYQGLIKQKGTKNSIDALKGAKFKNLNTSIEFYENWAVRLGEYGATEQNNYIELIVDEQLATANPSGMQLVTDIGDTTEGFIGVTPDNVYKSQNYSSPAVFRTVNSALPQTLREYPGAGFVNLNDVDATIFDLNDYATLTTIVNDIGTGYKIWTARDLNGSWNVYRATAVTGIVYGLQYNFDDIALVTMDMVHGLSPSDIVILKSFDSRFDGVYKVETVASLTSFTVRIFQNLADLVKEINVVGNGLLLKLDSVKVAYPYQVDSYRPRQGWIKNDKIWVENLDNLNNWGVFNKSDPWNFNSKLELDSTQYVGNDLFGQVVEISRAGILYAAAPFSGTGRAAFYSQSINNSWISKGSLQSFSASVSQFGFSIAVSESETDRYTVIGAPGTLSSRGCVYVFKNEVCQQIIVNPAGSAGHKFGQSVAIGAEGRIIYVGSPGNSQVFCYALNTLTVVQVQAPEIVGDGIANSFALSISGVTNPSQLYVREKITGTEYLPYIDYTVSGGNIVFTTIPLNGLVFTIIKSTDNYSVIETITTGAAGSDNFGDSISTNLNADVLAVGANTETIDSLANAGAVHVYHRTISVIEANGITGTFIPNNALNSVFYVYKNNELLLNGTDYYISGASIIFPPFFTPEAGSIIRIESNQFPFDQLITGTVKKDNQFGSKVKMCGSGCNLYVTAPGYSIYTAMGQGKVSRFINNGRVYGEITGTVQNPVVTSGHQLIINNYTVTFTGTSLATVIVNINNAQIPGVTASNVNNKLRITSNVRIALEKLFVFNGTGSAMADLGLQNYYTSQEFFAPEGDDEKFALNLAVYQDSGTLAISSDGGDLDVEMLFDAGELRIDSGSTRIIDIVKETGAVYLYSLMNNPNESADSPSLYAYTQKLKGTNIATGDRFGAAMAIVGKNIAVGLSNDSDRISKGGSVYTYLNPLQTPGWELIRFKQDRVDIGATSSVFTYNRQNNLLVNFYDYIDPIKGKILGVVDQEIDYKENFDPALYNYSTNSNNTLNKSFYWHERQVGKTWWDLSQCAFIDYEQSDLQYRLNNWGSLFPGSRVRIYEWVKSAFLPSQYIANGGNGIPKHVDDSAYTVVTQVDSATGIITQNYYYWVSDRTEVDQVTTNRSMTTTIMELYITNPRDRGIPYVALLSPNAFAIYNTVQNLVSDKIVIHFDLNTEKSQNLIHTEYELIQENNPRQILPRPLVNKLRDSLTGIDSIGRIVPDPALKLQDKIGIANKPNQSLFVNRLPALSLYIDQVNQVFLQYPILLISDTTLLYSADPVPTVGYDIEISMASELDYIDTTTLSNGYKVLIRQNANYQNKWTIYNYNASEQEFQVERIQGFLTPLSWAKTDWYSADYVEGRDANYTVDIFADIQKLSSLSQDEYIKVNDNGNNEWLIYRVEADASLTLIAAQNATLQLNASLGDVSLGSGFDSVLFDLIDFDPEKSVELSNIFDSVYQQIFVKDLAVEFNKLFFDIVNYIFTEQPSTDWIFKTSFIDVVHELRTLEQVANYSRDDQTFYQDYINEVKPYRTKIKEYIPTYINQDNSYNSVTDFDLPSSWYTDTETFRAPSISNTSDSTDFTLEPYKDWYDNYKYKITGAIVSDSGANFTVVPSLTVSGGGGTGANLTAIINAATGKITGVSVTNAGSGYTSTPTITVNGVGEGAKIYPILHNEYYTLDSANSYNTTRSFNTAIRFDRVTYSSNVFVYTYSAANVQIPPAVLTGDLAHGNLRITSGNIVAYNNEAFLFNQQWGTILPFDYTKVTKLDSGNVLLNAYDRIVTYYKPTVGMLSNVATQLMTGLEYPGTKIFGPEFRANAFEIISDVIGFKYSGLTITSADATKVNFVQLGFQTNQPVRIEALVPFNFENNGTFTIVSVSNTAMMLTGQPIATTWKLNVTAPITVQVGDYITQANSSGNAWVTKQAINSTSIDVIKTNPNFISSVNVQINGSTTVSLFSDFVEGGTANVKLSSLNLDANVIDTIVTGTYLDGSLGSRPEDITIEGGAYVDVYSSHAPEEFIPGRMYDCLDIKVFSNNAVNTTTYGYRIFQAMSSNVVFKRIADENTTTLTSDLELSANTIFVNNAAKLPAGNPSSAIPGIVNINGEMIHYYQRYLLADILTAVPWTANTIFAGGTIANIDGNTYLVTGNIYANSNTYINTANISKIYANSLTQLRRGVDGTGAANLHVTGSRVVDTSIQQSIPGSSVFYSDFVNFNKNVAANVTYRVSLSSNITANIGDYLTQFIGNTGNLRILSNVTNGNVVAVDIVSHGVWPVANLDYTLNLSQPITANRGDRITQFFEDNTYLLELSSPVTSNVGDFITQFQGNTYSLQLSSAISANVGDYITQFVGNLSNLEVVRSNVTSGTIINVKFITGNVENIQLAANIGTRVNIANLLSSGGSVFSQTTANIVSITINGFSPTVYTVGNANLRVTRSVVQSNVVPVQFVSGSIADIKTAANIGTRVNIANLRTSSFHFSSANINSIVLAPNVQSNLRVRANVTSSLTVPVEFIIGNVASLKLATNAATRINVLNLTSPNTYFYSNANITSVDIVGFGSNVLGNIGTRVNLVSITNGVSVTTANIVSLQPLGTMPYTSNVSYPRFLYANGNVTLQSVSLLSSNVFVDYGTALGLESSTNAYAQFIRAKPSYTP